MKLLDPMVLPYYGCASFNHRGERCSGNKTIYEKCCQFCLCFDSMKEKNDVVKKKNNPITSRLG